MADPTAMYNHSGTLLSQARQWVPEHRDDEGGCTCPCCGAWRHVIRYHISGAWAQSLGRLLQFSGPTLAAVHYDDWGIKNRMHSLMRHWGLIIPVGENPDNPFGKSGIWRPTQLAVDWMEGNMVIARTILVDDNTLIGFEDPYLTFEQALGEPFDPESFYSGGPQT